LVELRIRRIVWIHAEYEAVVFPFAEVAAFGTGVGAKIAVDEFSVAVAFVSDHALAELWNDAAVYDPLLLGVVVDYLHQAVVPLAGDIVGRLPEVGFGA